MVSSFLPVNTYYAYFDSALYNQFRIFNWLKARKNEYGHFYESRNVEFKLDSILWT